MEGFKEIKCFRTKKTILLEVGVFLISIHNLHTDTPHWSIPKFMFNSFEDYRMALIGDNPNYNKGMVNLPYRYYNKVVRNSSISAQDNFTPLDRALILQTIKDQLKLPEE